MKSRLLELLVCPHCLGSFSCRTDEERDGEIWSGRLYCACGSYPVLRFIPRLIDEYRTPAGNATSPGASPPLDGEDGDVFARTRKSFGYQWTAFGKMSSTFERNFLDYIGPIAPSFFPRKLGLDAGCGFGRHIYHARRFGAEMVGLDASRAIDVARANAHSANTHFVQADLLKPPFRSGTFDFVYCLGVLHHLPDPESGFRALAKLKREGGSFWIWVYSKKRPVVNALIEGVRFVTTWLPLRTLHALSYTAAALDFGLFVAPARALRGTGLSRFVPPRLRLYADYPFQVSVADWFDRLAAPVRFYYDEQDLRGWAERVQWSDYRVEPTGLYGFKLQSVVNESCAALQAP